MAVLDVATGHYTLHRVPIPIYCDNLYQGGLYVAWVVLRSQAHVRWYRDDDRWSLTDSKSYINALESRNDSTSPLVTSLSDSLSPFDSTHSPSPTCTRM